MMKRILGVTHTESFIIITIIIIIIIIIIIVHFVENVRGVEEGGWEGKG